MQSATSSQTATTTPGVVHLRGDRPKINGQRMNDTLHESCQWGCTPDGGMSKYRLTLNNDDAQVRRWFVEMVKQLGCTVTIDSMGNIFAVYPGKRAGPPIAMGSHLDTQPTGGRYDGILGVLAGLEVLRTLHDQGIVPENPLAVIVWTNEEGSRYAPAMLGSGVWAHHYTLDYGYTRTDTEGVDLKSELVRHGFLGETRSSYQAIPLKAHFEVHIEQGPILDMAEAPVAAVSGVQAMRWFQVKLQGRGSHAGTTPMRFRRDPLAAFGRFVVEAEQTANELDGLATVGRMWSDTPLSTNVIVDNVAFHLDLRHHEDKVIDQMEARLRAKLDAFVAEAQGVEVVEFERIADNAAVVFDPTAVGCVKAACGGYPPHIIVSGAGHDSVHTAKHCPTAMIFIRCKDGISHHPSEFSTPEDISIGTQVLLDSVLAYDAKSH